MVKNTIRLPKILFSIKQTKRCKEDKGKMFRTFAGMTSLTLNSKLCKFITLLNLTKTLQNFGARLFLHKIDKNMP